MASDKSKSIVTQTFPMEDANEALATLWYGEVWPDRAVNVRFPLTYWIT